MPPPTPNPASHPSPPPGPTAPRRRLTPGGPDITLHARVFFGSLSLRKGGGTKCFATVMTESGVSNFRTENLCFQFPSLFIPFIFHFPFPIRFISVFPFHIFPHVDHEPSARPPPVSDRRSSAREGHRREAGPPHARRPTPRIPKGRSMRTEERGQSLCAEMVDMDALNSLVPKKSSSLTFETIG